ncbi:MAG: amidohydrolase family protein, partial [Candidatus Dormiibacterota bacterium]
IVAATSDAAALLRIDDEGGQLKVGQFADLLIVDSDPLVDIRNLSKTAIVIRDGHVIFSNGVAAQGDFLHDTRPVPPGPWPLSSRPVQDGADTSRSTTGGLTV